MKKGGADGVDGGVVGMDNDGQVDIPVGLITVGVG
jgi:hypothetical protein